MEKHFPSEWLWCRSEYNCAKRWKWKSHDDNKNGPAKITPSTLGLMFRRISEISTNADIKASQDLDILNGYFYHIKISQYCDDALLYESDSERIQKLKNSLKKQYHLYSECLQRIDESFYSK
jgi:hypothetical protein